MKHVRSYIILVLILLCYMPSLRVGADEDAVSVLGDAWPSDQEINQKASVMSEVPDEGQQIFYITGMAYYQKIFEALAIVNQRRAEAGLDLLVLDEELTEAAMERAVECSVFYGHVRPNGMPCASICTGIDAENIAASTGMLFSTADAVMDAWMNSAGHQQNIMNQSYLSIGIGCFYKDGVWYWAQEFSREEADPAVMREDGFRTYGVQALKQYADPFFAIEHYNMEKGQQIQYQIKLYNMGWSNASGYIDQNSYQWVSSSPQITVDQSGSVFAEGWGAGTVTAINAGKGECRLTGTIDVHTDAVIEDVGEVYIQQGNRNGLIAGLPLSLSKSADVEYSWYVAAGDGWRCLRDWAENEEWLFWIPDCYGDYTVAVQARVAGNPVSAVTKLTPFRYHPQIAGKCQMPYTGEGGGYLIGVESYENPEQKYQYEMLILDCSLLAEGEDAWIYSTGRCQVNTGKAFWTVWQPQYGYYWTLFRIYDEQGNLIDEECYGFQNI